MSVKEGPANRSYGLAVAKLAGVPAAVIAAARRYLAQLEAQRDAQVGAAPSPQATLPFDAQVPGTARPDPTPDSLRERLARIEPDALSPREAHDLLYELKGLINPP
jgi:DNA mismatch repair protein MutS